MDETKNRILSIIASKQSLLHIFVNQNNTANSKKEPHTM